MRAWILVCVCGLAFAGQAAADPLTLTATGRVSAVFSAEIQDVLGVTASVGDPFTVKIADTTGSLADFEANFSLMIGSRSFSGFSPGFVELNVAEDTVRLFVEPLPSRTSDPPSVTAAFLFFSKPGDPRRLTSNQVFPTASTLNSFSSRVFFVGPDCCVTPFLQSTDVRILPAGGPAPTPEPATILLLGLGLLSSVVGLPRLVRADERSAPLR